MTKAHLDVIIQQKQKYVTHDLSATLTAVLRGKDHPT
jgi:hypothetical protein